MIKIFVFSTFFNNSKTVSGMQVLGMPNLSNFRAAYIMLKKNRKIVRKRARNVPTIEIRVKTSNDCNFATAKTKDFGKRPVKFWNSNRFDLLRKIKACIKFVESSRWTQKGNNQFESGKIASGRRGRFGIY